MLRWPTPREALIDWPAAVAETGFAWYRVYMLILVTVAALTLPTMVAGALIAWLFGIRWGW